MESIDFQAVVSEAVASLPPHIREKLTDIAIVVEEEPKREQRGRLLLGLYEGVPLTAWHRDASGKATDKITLYRKNIERIAGSPEEVPRIIRETVWHEIGHYFGLDHDRIGKMERRWRAKRKQA